MTASVPSSHFQLFVPLFSLFFSLLSHLSPPCFWVHLSPKVPQFPAFSFFDFFSFFKSSSPSIPSSDFLSHSSLSCSDSHVFPGICDCVIRFDLGGRQRGCSTAQGNALRGFSVWTPSNLNADGNIFRGFNSTVHVISKRALFCFFTQVLSFCSH